MLNKLINNKEWLISLIFVIFSILSVISYVFIRIHNFPLSTPNNSLSSVSVSKKFCSAETIYNNIEDASLNPELVCQLSISNQDFTKIPIQVYKLTKLQVLDLHSNKIETIDPEISSLTKLIHLDLGDNNIASIPSELTNLPELQIVELGFNKIKFIPEFILGFKNLKELSLNNNQLKSVPSNLKDLKSLKSLELRNNNFTKLELEKIKSGFSNINLSI